MNELTNRKSIRRYKKNIVIPREILDAILKDTLRAPSSMNLQPVRFVIIESQEAREKLRPLLRGNITQLETASALVLLMIDFNKYAYAERIYSKAVDLDLMPKSVMERQLETIKNLSKNATYETDVKTNLVDLGIMAMQLMHVAKAYGYDSCPIGGFKKMDAASAFGFDKNRYEAVLIISLGIKGEEGFTSVRLDLDNITTYF